MEAENSSDGSNGHNIDQFEIQEPSRNKIEKGEILIILKPFAALPFLPKRFVILFITTPMNKISKLKKNSAGFVQFLYN